MDSTDSRPEESESEPLQVWIAPQLKIISIIGKTKANPINTSTDGSLTANS